MNTNHPKKKKESIFNERRRTLLLTGAAGVGAFILGKILGPSLNVFAPDQSVKEFDNFRIVDTKDEMRFFDKLGNEIVIIEKDGFTQ